MVPGVSKANNFPLVTTTFTSTTFIELFKQHLLCSRLYYVIFVFESTNFQLPINRLTIVLNKMKLRKQKFSNKTCNFIGNLRSSSQSLVLNFQMNCIFDPHKRIKTEWTREYNIVEFYNNESSRVSYTYNNILGISKKRID